MLLAHRTNLDEVDERTDFFLDAFKANQAVQLLHQRIERFFLLVRLLFVLRFFRSCVVLHCVLSEYVDASRCPLHAAVTPGCSGHQKRPQSARIRSDKIQLIAAHIAVHIRRGIKHTAHAIDKLLGGRRAFLVVHRHAAAQEQRRSFREGAILKADVERLCCARLADTQNVPLGYAGDIGQHRLGNLPRRLCHLEEECLHIHIQKELDIARTDALPVAARHQLIARLIHHLIGGATLCQLLFIHGSSLSGVLPLRVFCKNQFAFLPSLRRTARSLLIIFSFSLGLNTNTALSGI